MAGSTCMLGDCIAQTLTPYLIYKYNCWKNPEFARKNPKFKVDKPYDLSRTLKFGLIGLLYIGPIDSRWLRILDKIVPKTSKHNVSKKVAADQFMFDPVLTFGYLVLITYMSTPMEKLIYPNNRDQREISLKDSINLATDEILPIMIKSWPYWILVQYANFAFIPLNFRLLVIQTANIAWNSFLSWYSMRSVEQNFGKKEEGDENNNENDELNEMLPIIEITQLNSSQIIQE